jgi:excisionase family DNA binding protein
MSSEKSITGSLPLPRRLLKPREAAEYLRISIHTVSAWTRKGKLRYVRIGGLIRYDIADLDRLIDENKEQENEQT